MRKAIIFFLLIPILVFGQQPPQAPADPAQPQQQADPDAAPPEPPQDAQAQPPEAEPAQPQAQPATPADPAPTPPTDATPAPQSPQQPTAPAPEIQSSGSSRVSFRNLREANLLEVVDLIANTLGMNYILDPGLRGGTVSINTYGELTTDDLFPLLETILRMHGAAAVKIGEFYRISPAADVPRLPISPTTDPDAKIPDDERMLLNVIRFSYTTAADIATVLEPFLGPGAVVQVVEQANLLLILDNSRNMRRTMELVGLFDTEEMTSQRMRLFPIENSLASSLASELSRVFAAFSFSESQAGIQFVPIERISSILVVTGNPSAFKEVEEWIEKLDQPVTVGGVQTFVYRVQYGLAGQLAQTLMMLYSPIGFGGGYGGGYGGYGGGGFGGGFIQLPTGMAPGLPMVAPRPDALGIPQPQAGVATDQTGELLGGAPVDALSQAYANAIRIVPDELNNLILVQSTKQEWEIVHKTLQQLDFPPRQVLIDAKIYEVTLVGAFSAGVSAVLQNRGSDTSSRKLTGGFDTGGNIGLSIGALVGNTRELAAILDASQSDGRTRILSAPSVIATDNIAASITVGTSVPTLSSQAVAAGAQQDGSSLFTNTVSNVQTGVTLSITPRVNASGIVTLQINQEVSAPLPVSGAIQSPSIQRRNVTTQITMADGDTAAIGGIMSQTDIFGRSRVPVLGKIPFLGGLFGSTSSSKEKTELIILITPRVIYDENELVSMSEELKGRLRGVQRLMRN